MGEPNASGAAELRAERTIAAPPEAIWRACTTPSAVERWWGPPDLRTTVRRLEVRPGGAVLFHLRHLPALFGRAGSDAARAAGVPLSFAIRGHLEVVEPLRRLDFCLTLAVAGTEGGIDFRLRLDLLPEADGTRVAFFAAGPAASPGTDSGPANIDRQLERLADVVAAG